MTTLTDWRLLSGPGITVNTTAPLPYVRVDNTRNVIISGIDFSLHGGACVFFVNSPNLTVTKCVFGGPNLVHLTASRIFSDLDSPGLTVSQYRRRRRQMGPDHRLSARPAPERRR